MSECHWCDEGRPFMRGGLGQHEPLYGGGEHSAAPCYAKTPPEQGIPCRFCGSGETLLYWLPDSEPKVCHVACKCGASGPWAESDEEAERLWMGALTIRQRDDLIDEAERKLRWLE